MLDDLGCSDKPFHLTEIGWPSLLIGNARQAAYLVRGALLSAAAGVSSFCWYTFYDEEPDSTIPTEDYFGLYYWPDGITDPDPKESWLALTALSQILGASQYAGDLGDALGLSADDGYALTFADSDGLWTVAFWHAGLNLDTTLTATIPFHPDATGSWTIFDQQGNELNTGEISDGSIELEMTGRVGFMQFSVQ